LPADWELRHSTSRNKPYFYNKRTGESRWEPPESSMTPSSNEVRVKHILVKHVGSRRPSSWKQVGEFEIDHKETADRSICLNLN
jgi:peptidyl-prolyl cis-trans isomerase NIMA-interacting 1